ncbi:MAG: MMPL family transporter [Gammaproteobacteria bacterium]|nr:MMPL family transporter [Gammaproteobacteria bacterium]
MKFLLSFSQKNPVSILIFFISLALLAATQLSNLRIDISAQSMVVETDQTWIDYQKSLDTFGSDRTIIIFINDEQLLSSKKLDTIRQAINKLEQLPFVIKAQSLFNVPNVKEDDEYISTVPFLETIPQTPEEFNTLLKEANENSLVSNNLISKDGKSLAINLSLLSESESNESDEEIVTQIESIISPLNNDFHQVFQMGGAFITHSISKQLAEDQLLIGPISLFIMILILGLSLKNINCSIVPVLTAVISIILTLSIMAMLDIPINILTSIVPALILIIGSTEDVHLMTEYQIAINQGLEKSEAVAQLSKNQSLAITLTFITTFIGFISITINDLSILSQFGWVASLGLLINFLVTVLVVPAFLFLFGSTAKNKLKTNNLYERSANFIFKLVIRFKKTTLLLIFITSVGFIWGAQFIQINNNSLEFFQKDSDVYQRANTLHEKLSGMQTFSIILDSNIEGTFEKIRYLEDIYAIQNYLDNLNIFDKSFSFADFMMLTHKVMEGNTALSLPIEDETVQAYLSLIDSNLFKDFVSEDLSSSRIIVRHHISSSNELKQHIDSIQDFIDNSLGSKLDIYFTGESILTNQAAEFMAISQIQSLILMIIVIFLLISSLFVDIKAGIVALIPNIFPVIVLFGVMGYFNIPLDTGTIMVAIIALGICVDDTIHFLSRYHYFTRGESNIEKALLKTTQHEATAISTTSVALAVGFATLTLSSFEPVIHFGALSALVMITALFSTFVLTPILLSYTRLITAWEMLTLKLQSAVLNKSEFFKGLRSYEIKTPIPV